MQNIYYYFQFIQLQKQQESPKQQLGTLKVRRKDK